MLAFLSVRLSPSVSVCLLKNSCNHLLSCSGLQVRVSLRRRRGAAIVIFILIIIILHLSPKPCWSEPAAPSRGPSAWCSGIRSWLHFDLWPGLASSPAVSKDKTKENNPKREALLLDSMDQWRFNLQRHHHHHHHHHHHRGRHGHPHLFCHIPQNKPVLVGAKIEANIGTILISPCPCHCLCNFLCPCWNSFNMWVQIIILIGMGKFPSGLCVCVGRDSGKSPNSQQFGMKLESECRTLECKVMICAM